MIDLHCHILAGLDDGPADLDASLAMARAHADAGVRRVVATPHVTCSMPNDAPGIALAVAELELALAAEAIPLRVSRGAEIGLARAVELDDPALDALALAGGPWKLVEAPLRAGEDTAADFRRLQRRGHRLLIAHPERSPAFQGDPAVLTGLVAAGALVQVTAGALVGRFGAPVQRVARDFVHRGLVHVVASDAHDTTRRAPGLRAEIDAAGFGDRAEWLTRDVPAALVGERQLPAGLRAA
ncbi:tyrosine-protein phosphatase [Capillimicrobium parvum]|uniref:protein-tyrosine-phosphatase n=1 Tax=Capillimicrobium parvum TaxID=2884022 RepID=A0A9E7BZF2_9ACTN|nr:CpsB/CapC family capsule biosynthesis tyrosine phosphatase [Capillimicrobium parvum]UGS34333.1 Tyrosine-protein phosphatase YwqE [Capillimicrobium parvum]